MGKWHLRGENSNVGLSVNETFETARELDAVLSRVIDKAAPSGSILDLTSPTGATLSFAISGEHGYVHFEQFPPDGPYFWALGNAGLSRDDGVIAFWYLGDESEIPMRNSIRPDQVLPVVREFFETDARPTSIDWEEV
jgi:hypothetical protein